MLLELALLACGLIYLTATWRFDYWRKKGVPHLKPHPFTGNIGKVLAGKQQVHEVLAEAYDAFPNAPVVGFWTLNKPALVIRDLDIAKHILVRDFHSFTNRGFRPDMELEPQAARAMFSLRDGAWRTVRTKLSPVFTSGKMKLMHPLMVECCRELPGVIAKEASRNSDGDGETSHKSVDVGDLNSRLFIDIITSCAFGGVGKALTDPTGSVVYKILNGILRLNWKQGLGALCMQFAPYPLYRLLCRVGFGFYDPEKLDLTSRLVEAELQQRDVHGKVREDAIGLSIQLRDKERAAGVPPDQSVFEGHYFTAIALQFLLAGSETSSSTMNFTLYELALQPELQTRLRDHIRGVLAKYDNDISYDAIQNMPFLEMVVNETLRLYPILPFLDRICSEVDYIIPGTDILIEKNTMVFIPIFSIQRDAKFFPDPECFDPDRWQPDNEDRVTKDAFMTFGAGPRYCIGNRFAMNSMKIGLCHILLAYEILPTPEVLREGLVLHRRSLNLNLEEPLRLILRPLESTGAGFGPQE